MKLTNVITTRFGDNCNLVREGHVFIKDEDKIASKVGYVKRGIAFLGKLVF